MFAAARTAPSSSWVNPAATPSVTRAGPARGDVGTGCSPTCAQVRAGPAGGDTVGRVPPPHGQADQHDQPGGGGDQQAAAAASSGGGVGDVVGHRGVSFGGVPLQGSAAGQRNAPTRLAATATSE